MISEPYRAVWPILEPQPLADHITYARQDLLAMLAEAGLIALSWPDWHIEDDHLIAIIRVSRRAA